MIVPMIKYSFILFHKEHEAFLSELQELGLVDITVSDWEPNETERRLLSDIDAQRAAMGKLKELRMNPERTPVEPFDSPQETLNRYMAATAEIERLQNEIAKTEKEVEELKPWGDFSKEKIDQLADKGIKLHFFSAFSKDYTQRIPQWEQDYAVEKIAEKNGNVYFVVVTGPDVSQVEINANEIKAPVRTWQQHEEYLEGLMREQETQQVILERSAEGIDALEEYGKRMREELHLSKVETSSTREAEGTLVVMEGWAPVEVQDKVDAFLAADDRAYSVKEEPKEEDEPPVLLKNNRFASIFEIIGGFYSLPKYGTVDMTAYFAPFYMIFFGFCLADAGYGALYVIAALIARFKVPKKFQNYVSLLLCCGIATIFFGLLTGNAFGIDLVEQPIFKGISKYMIDSNQLFYTALGVGVFHIIYALTLKVIFTSRIKGFKYALSSLGWIMVLVSYLSSLLLPMFDIEAYNTSSVPFWIVTGTGLFLMFFMNSPGKNPFVNFGAGLWNTYNDVVGFISDGLSYIRLFALGLSGGILALVFNKLAMDMSPDIIVVKQLVMVLILAIGQGLTLFMSSLSAFVHPLRLTFVEFYKNAGFAEGGRPFNPLKKENE